jgi:uncharacterized protein
MPPPERQTGVIVCNAGPLIALAGIQMLPLLQKLHPRVLLADAVYHELTNSERFAGQTGLFNLPWLEKRKVAALLDPLLSAELGPGEAETIALAVQTGAERVLIDERKGRRFAELVYHLKVTGTGGILLAAKQAGLVNEIRPLMTQMRDNGYFLSARLIDGICESAGE